MIIKSTLQEFIKRVGSLTEVGRMLGVPRQQVHIAIIQNTQVLLSMTKITRFLIVTYSASGANYDY